MYNVYMWFVQFVHVACTLSINYVLLWRTVPFVFLDNSNSY